MKTMQHWEAYKRPFDFLAVGLAIGISGCGSSPTILSPYESRLGIEDGASREFHSSLYYPKGLALQYPGYVVGIQKADQAKVRGPGATGRFPSFLDPSPTYFTEGERGVRWGLGSHDLLQKLTTDPKSLFVSHITRYSFEQDAGPRSRDETPVPYTYMDSCFLYNAFRSPFFQLTATHENPQAPTRQWSDLNQVIAWKDCKKAPRWTGRVPQLHSREFYSNGVPAIRALAASAAQDLRNDGYTHVLILVMGWNTAQDEAIRNFNDITGNLLEAARESEAVVADQDHQKRLPFRPLVIGVSWPSYWSRGITNAFSYANKAKDADELGISWMNLLVNRELPDAMKAARVSVPVILIGHSFGARVVTRAAGASPALIPKTDSANRGIHSGANLVVGLQGAVSINRFWPDIEGDPPGDEGSPLRDFAKFESTRFAFTASSHDTAAGGPTFWFDPSGSIKSYRLACNAKSSDWRKRVFHCLIAGDTSGLDAPLAGQKRWEEFRICETDAPSDCRGVGKRIASADRRVLYIDASDGVTEFNTLGTGGNAHSDIYRLPMGRLLWVLISSFAPAEQ